MSVTQILSQLWIYLWERMITLCSLAILLLFLSPFSVANSLDELYKLFNVDLPTVDIVILLDASGSMRQRDRGVRRYDAAREAVLTIGSTLTEKENVQLRIFGDVVSNPLEGRGNEILGRINDFLPREASFRYTDLGTAIHKGLEFLERADASPVQAFFLITDGIHDPPPYSPYTRNFSTDPNWLGLRERAHALCSRSKVLVYGFGIGEHTDIAVLLRVFPSQNVELVIGQAVDIANAFTRARESLRREQLRHAVEKELQEGRVQVQLAQTTISGNISRFELPITVHNVYRRLPVILKQVTMRSEGPGSSKIQMVIKGMPLKVTLKPGEKCQGLVKGSLRTVGARRWQIGKQKETLNAAIHFLVDAEFPTEIKLNELGFYPTKPKVKSDSLDIAITIQYGISLLTLATVCSFLVFGFAAFLARPVRRVRTRAVLRLIDFPAGIPDIKKEWTIEAGSTYVIGSKKGVDIYLPQTQPEHARVHLRQDGSFELSQANGNVQVEEQKGNRIRFRVGQDYQFSVEVRKIKYWAFLPVILWGIALLSLVLALASYFFDP